MWRAEIRRQQPRALAVVLAVLICALTPSQVRANRNPPSCVFSSGAYGLRASRDTPRCRGGDNNFTQCTVDSECPSGACAAGGTCSAGVNSNAPCVNDVECPRGACVLGDANVVGDYVDGETVYLQTSVIFNLQPGVCGFEGGRLCVNLPGTGCPPSFDEIAPRRCFTGLNTRGCVRDRQ